MPRECLAIFLVPALVLLSAPLGAQQEPEQQQVRGVVTENGTGAPIEGAMILLFGLDGKRFGGVLSASNGRFRIPVPDPGRYVIRVERIGYASMDTEPFEVPAGTSVEQLIVSTVRPIQLAGLDVKAARRCEVRPAEGMATATVWEEVRKALASATWTSDRAIYRFEWMRFERKLDQTGRRVLSEQRRYDRRFSPQPFTAADPRELAANGFVWILPGGNWQYWAPDAKVLLSDAFLDTHCFKLTSEERDGTLLIGLVFEPISGRRLTDVAGVLWLEPATARLRSVQFTYMNLMPGLHGGGGTLTFVDLPNGTWIVKEWTIRMPTVTETRDSRTGNVRFRVTGYHSTGGSVQRALTNTGDVVMDGGAGSIRGIVTDSLGQPVTALRVWVEGTSMGTLTDSAGAFGFLDIGRGTWTLSTTFPALEAIGSEAVQVDVLVGDTGIGAARLRLPSVASLVLARCRANPPAPDEAVLAGRVLDTHGAPVPGATVTVSWQHVSSDVAADDNGIFTFCAAPTGTSGLVRATLGERGSEAVEVLLRQGTAVAVATVVLPDPSGR
jgi:hypothetical protein